jgi:transcriptional regulator with XRE-family HTH domain
MEHLLGRRIASYREQLEMSQEELANATGLDLTLLQAIEGEQVAAAPDRGCRGGWWRRSG